MKKRIAVCFVLIAMIIFPCQGQEIGAFLDFLADVPDDQKELLLLLLSHIIAVAEVEVPEALPILFKQVESFRCEVDRQASTGESFLALNPDRVSDIFNESVEWDASFHESFVDEGPERVFAGGIQTPKGQAPPFDPEDCQTRILVRKGGLVDADTVSVDRMQTLPLEGVCSPDGKMAWSFETKGVGSQTLKNGGLFESLLFIEPASDDPAASLRGSDLLEDEREVSAATFFSDVANKYRINLFCVCSNGKSNQDTILIVQK